MSRFFFPSCLSLPFFLIVFFFLLLTCERIFFSLPFFFVGLQQNAKSEVLALAHAEKQY